MAINTLEMKETDPTKLCFARKQTLFTKNNLLNKEVFLYGDKTQPERDKYNRILAYVATSSQNFTDTNNFADTYFYNDYLVDTGNADTYRATPKAFFFDRLEDKKNKAKEAGLDMWGNGCEN
jgi:endonuclease YncB( thermonuclease family)